MDHQNANTQELRQRLLPLLEGKKICTLAQLAQTCEVSELAVARALPEEMCRMAPATVFEEVWQEMSHWESATFIMEHGGSVVEIKGRIPQGKYGGGYFNLKPGQPLGGHISASVAHMAFLSLPFMGLESHSLQFFNAQGDGLFAVYVGRENRQLIPTARQSFFDLLTRLTLEA